MISKKMKKMAYLLTTAMVILTLTGCGDEATNEKKEDVAVVKVSSPTWDSLKIQGRFIGTITPDEFVYVIPKTTSEVLEVNVNIGDKVNEGDVLAVLDDTMAQFTMDSAKLNLANANSAYKLSYGDGATTLNNMQVDNNIEQAKTQVTTLQERMVDTINSKRDYETELKKEQDNLAKIKNDYGIKDNASELLDDVENNSFAGILGSSSDMSKYQKYQEAATKISTSEMKISQYKQAIDQCDEGINTLQKNIDTAYKQFTQVVTSTGISNGELREEQKKVSKNQIAAANLGIEQATENLKLYNITANISGVIEAVNIKPHDFATSSNPAFVISNKENMLVTYYVAEEVRTSFSLGQKVKIVKDNQEYEGEVAEIGSTVDNTTGLFKIKARVKGNGVALLSGTKAEIITDTMHEDNALVIPYDSVYYEDMKAYVYTVVDGRAKKVDIETGLYNTDNIVVTSGLTENDILVTTWSAQLRDGVAIQIME